MLSPLSQFTTSSVFCILPIVRQSLYKTATVHHLKTGNVNSLKRELQHTINIYRQLLQW